MQEYIDTSTAAKLLDVDERTVQRNAKNGIYGDVKYIDGRGHAGKVIQISITGLPIDAQIKYVMQQMDAPLHVTPLDDVPEKYRAIALKKLKALEAMTHYIWAAEKAGRNKKDAMQEFADKYNIAYPDEHVSIATLYRWMNDYREAGIAGLVPGYMSREWQSTIPDWAWDMFKSLYLDENKRSISACYTVIELEAQKRGEPIPSISAFKRRIKKEMDYQILTYYREGPKAFDDKCVPYIQRDYTALVPNQCWVSDHHQLDVACMGSRKRPIFPWITVWMDMRSRRIVGYRISEGPNTDIILDSFGRAIRRYGIPLEIYMDNGRDYTAYDFAGRGHRVTADIDEERIAPLVRHLGIVPHFALPENAKAKPVERFFETVKEQFSKWFLTYRGGNVQERPERLNDVMKKPENIPAIAEIDKLFGDWVDSVYNENPHTGDGMNGKSPREVFDKLLPVKRTAPDDVLRLFMMRTSKPLKVQRNGIWLFGRWYYSPELAPHQEHMVYVRYELQQVGTVYVFDTEDRFLCTAANREALAWGATADDIRQAMKEKKQTRQRAKAYKDAVAKEVMQPDPLRRVIEARQEAKEESAPATNVVELVRNPEMEKAAGDMKRVTEAAESGQTRQKTTDDWLIEYAEMQQAKTKKTTMQDINDTLEIAIAYQRRAMQNK